MNGRCRDERSTHARTPLIAARSATAAAPLDGSVHVTVHRAPWGVASTPVAAANAVCTPSRRHGPNPAPFTARTRASYRVPDVRPVNVVSRADAPPPTAVHAPHDAADRGLIAASYPVTVPDAALHRTRTDAAGCARPV